jgi:uncharacterized DUF497 family protein
MLFDWDPEKRRKNLLERNIDFTDAALVWDDPMRQERVDYRKDYGEVRYQSIGKVSFGILFVVYTGRVSRNGEDVIRIISVRKANARDNKEYESRTFHLRRIE